MDVDPKIVKAVHVVRSKVRTLARDSFNPHGRYKYTSIDTFYEKVVPFTNEAGLVWRAREKDWSLIDHNGKSYVKSAIVFDLFADGAAANDYMQITIALPLTGPQTTGALYSYADKVFMKVAFGIATGESDGDDIKQEEGARRVLPTGLPSSPQRVERFEDGDVPEGVDPITGEVLTAEQIADAKSFETVADTSDQAIETEVTAGKSKDGDPVIDTRKVDAQRAELILGIFQTWMPKIRTKDQLIDWRAENVAAIEKLAKIDPVYKDRVNGLFTEKFHQFTTKEKSSA